MIKDIQLNVDPESTRYPADDIPKRVMRWIERNKRPEEPAREDLHEGQVVIILEGVHASKRAVLLKRLPRNLVLCSGPSGEQRVPLVVMNQRYVLPASLSLAVGVSIPVNEEAVHKISQKDAENAVDLDASLFLDTSLQDNVDRVLERELAKKKGMKTYFSTPFAIPEGYCPLELNY